MRLSWHNENPPYNAGVDHGVLYGSNGLGTVWNGLLGVTETKTSIGTKIFLDGTVIRVDERVSGLSGSVNAFTYPDILENWFRGSFGLSYRVMNESGYELHILYGVKLWPDDRSFAAISDQISPGGFSWQMSSEIHLVIRSEHAAIGEIEDVLYGSSDVDSSLPSVDDLYSLADAAATLKITNHGDGTWTAEGPDDMVIVPGDGSFTIDSPSLSYLDDVTYQVSSY